MEQLIYGLLATIDADIMWVQRLFCRHKPMVIPNYATICEKCGKHLVRANGS